jgi:hypothetical protein
MKEVVQADKEVVARLDAAHVIISATSWTEDEDMYIWLAALCRLNR